MSNCLDQAFVTQSPPPPKYQITCTRMMYSLFILMVIFAFLCHLLAIMYFIFSFTTKVDFANWGWSSLNLTYLLGYLKSMTKGE